LYIDNFKRVYIVIIYCSVNILMVNMTKMDQNTNCDDLCYFVTSVNCFIVHSLFDVVILL